MEPGDEPEESFASKMKYYATLTFGTTACLSSFVFMFLIPWVLDPSISTLMKNFDPEPVVCKTVLTNYERGIKNCTWASCKKGCTTDLLECVQIYVNYMHLPWAEYDRNGLDENDEEIWVGRGVPLFINIKACGYPPGVNCSIFSDDYGEEGSEYACYYSRADPNMIITDYDWSNEVSSIILALLVPNLLCGVSLGIVSYWWYPGCQKRRCQYQLPPDQEDTTSNNADDEDGDDEDVEKDENEEGDGEEREDDDNEEGDMKSRPQEEEKDRDTCIIIPEEKV